MSRIESTLPVARHEVPALRESGTQLLAVIQQLQRHGNNVLSELIGSGSPVQWEHYPDDDVYDAGSGYRYYYHSHPGPRSTLEHGHFHLFAKLEGKAGDDSGFMHLIAVGVSAEGMPTRGFTTNRWVTNERWQPGDKVVRSARDFAVRHPQRLLLVHDWLQSLLGLFRPQLRWLLQRRDEVWQRARLIRPNFFEDRRSTVLSECAFDLRRQFAWLDRLDGARA